MPLGPLGLGSLQQLKKADFSSDVRQTLIGNSRLSAAGWRQLLGGLSAGVEDLSLKECGLDEEKVAGISPQLGRFQQLKKADFHRNLSLSAAGWRQLLGGLPAGVEDLSIGACDLNEEKVAVIAPQPGRFQQLKKADFAQNSSLSAAGWRQLLGGLPAGVEDLSVGR